MRTQKDRKPDRLRSSRNVKIEDARRKRRYPCLSLAWARRGRWTMNAVFGCGLTTLRRLRIPVMSGRPPFCKIVFIIRAIGSNCQHLNRKMLSARSAFSIAVNPYTDRTGPLPPCTPRSASAHAAPGSCPRARSAPAAKSPSPPSPIPANQHAVVTISDTRYFHAQAHFCHITGLISHCLRHGPASNSEVQLTRWQVMLAFAAMGYLRSYSSIRSVFQFIS